MKTTESTNGNEIKQAGSPTLLASLAVVLTLAASSIPTHAAIVAHWTFDESSGPTAHDSAGSFSGNLSPSGAAFVSGGISGNAISLNRAANGFVTMGNVLGLTSGDFSIVAWVKMNAGDTTSETVVLGKHAAFTDNGYLVGINSLGTGGRVNKALFYEGSVFTAPVSTNSVNDGNWHQVAAVYQAGGNKSIYVDGAPAEDIKPSQAFLSTSAPFLIGGDSPGGIPRGLFTGLIDDVQIYNHAISPGDVDFLFQHPGQVVLDCSQQLAAVQAQLAAANAANAALQAQLATANQTIQDLQNEILDLLLPLQLLTQDFRTMFNDPQFQIRGATVVEQMQNLVGEVLNLPRGQQQQLFIGLGGHKRGELGKTVGRGSSEQ